MNRFVLGACAIVAGGFCFAESQKLEVQEALPQVSGIQADAAGRARPLIFVRFQLQYSLFQNYLLPEVWNDRPLNFDRSLRYPSGTFEHMRESAFAQEIGLVNDCGVDGMAAFVSPLGLDMFEKAAATAKRAGAQNFLMLPELGSFTGADAAIKAALKTPYAWHLNDKLVVTSYEEMEPDPEKVNALRTNNGHQVSIVREITVRACQLRDVWKAGTLSEEVQEKFKADMRETLDLFDGILFAGAGELNRSRPAGRYSRQFEADFYERCLVPLLKSVLSEPAYQSKILGLSAVKAYICPTNGVNYAEDGTKRLRQSFEIALAAQPDFILLPEWNEANENTSFQPTVSASLATQRILRYYAGLISGEPLTPQSADDLSVPNLILSYRRAVKLGEMIRFEVLNVPDSDSKAEYKIRLSLKDSSGKIVHSFEEEILPASKLAEKTFSMASETLANASSLIPSLTVDNGRGRVLQFDSGLLPLELCPTWNRDYLEVHEPLRDVAQLQASFEVEEKDSVPGGRLKLRGSVNSDEELVSVEVLENGLEVYGYDRDQEFGNGDKIVISGKFSAATDFSLSGTLRVKNVTSFSLRPWDYANCDMIGWKVNEEGAVFSGQPVNTLERGFFLTLPSAEAAEAVLEFDLNIGKFEVPVRDLETHSAWAKLFPDHIKVALEKFTFLPDIPVHVDSKEVSFSFNTTPHRAFPVYHLRAITRSGKIYRSAPLRPWTPDLKDLVNLNVMSEADGKLATVQVHPQEILDLNYDFNPRSGDLLPVPAAKKWFGELGGGFAWPYPFWPFAGGERIPKGASIGNPEWVVEDGETCLKFDGLGNSVVLPIEAFPRGPFTLTFEIKPISDNSRREILFRHYGLLVGSLTLKRVVGKLQASFTDSNLKTTEFFTGLDLPKDQWSRVKVTYDLKNIVFQVNDGQRYARAFSGEAMYLMPSVFGGLTVPAFGVNNGDSFFMGYLKSLRIIHNASDS